MGRRAAFAPRRWPIERKHRAALAGLSCLSRAFDIPRGRPVLPARAAMRLIFAIAAPCFAGARPITQGRFRAIYGRFHLILRAGHDNAYCLFIRLLFLPHTFVLPLLPQALAHTHDCTFQARAWHIYQLFSSSRKRCHRSPAGSPID